MMPFHLLWQHGEQGEREREREREREAHSHPHADIPCTPTHTLYPSVVSVAPLRMVSPCPLMDSVRRKRGITAWSACRSVSPLHPPSVRVVPALLWGGELSPEKQWLTGGQRERRRVAGADNEGVPVRPGGKKEGYSRREMRSRRGRVGQGCEGWREGGRKLIRGGWRRGAQERSSGRVIFWNTCRGER